MSLTLAQGRRSHKMIFHPKKMVTIEWNTFKGLNTHSSTVDSEGHNLIIIFISDTQFLTQTEELLLADGTSTIATILNHKSKSNQQKLLQSSQSPAGGKTA